MADTADVFRREGDTWCCTFAGQTVRIRDLKGLHYLVRLLADPGRQFHVLELVAHETGMPEANASDDAGAVLDARAKQAYRRRLTEIEDDIAEATARNDLGRTAQAEAEREFLVRELSRAVGLGGRDRRVSSTVEQARVSVTRSAPGDRSHRTASRTTRRAPERRGTHRRALQLRTRARDSLDDLTEIGLATRFAIISVQDEAHETPSAHAPQIDPAAHRRRHDDNDDGDAVTGWRAIDPYCVAVASGK